VSPSARPVALVTGASRGIGRACAVALAGAGHDVAVAARTLHDGDARIGDDDEIVVPGGLDTTVASIEDAGGAGLAVRLDLLDPTTIDETVDATLERFGRIDVLVNNAIYQGPGSMTPFLELGDEELRRLFEGNVFAQLELIRRVLPGMIDQGGGTIVNMISATAHVDPPGKIGDGGWGMAYAMTKAAFERVAPLLCVEHGDEGVVAYSVDPGYVLTERAALNSRKGGHDKHFTPATPEVIGAAVAWLVTAPEGPTDLAGKIVFAQREAKRRHLVPGWPS
jgi:NAD(P)-dependent dehydrogenase (short-subunit alcohol dehydrogenase family)